MISITAINIYPVKSCRGIALPAAAVTDRGFAHDREWLIVRPDGRFVTQRDDARLALIVPTLRPTALELSAPGADTLSVPYDQCGERVEVTCWRDQCAAFDMGDRAGDWLTAYLGHPHRLVRFDPAHQRVSDPAWTKELRALNRFSDAFPWLLISQASLDDLNRRLTEALPMNRFRPNIVVDGLPPYGEDRALDFTTGAVRLRAVKPCTRCIVPTTNQATAERGTEPLATLRSYRFDRDLKGVTFGQNLILAEGAGQTLRVGDRFEVRLRDAAS
jgi:uncharacterized protein YcbX